jgi:hypothetical protein
MRTIRHSTEPQKSRTRGASSMGVPCARCPSPVATADSPPVTGRLQTPGDHPPSHQAPVASNVSSITFSLRFVAGKLRFVTGNVTGRTSKIARVYAGCNGVTAPDPWEPPPLPPSAPPESRLQPVTPAQRHFNLGDRTQPATRPILSNSEQI